MLEPDDREALLEATRKALHRLKVDVTFDVDVEAREGHSARVVARARDGHLTPLLGFMRQTDGGWVVLGFGTDFDAEFYEAHGVPASLRLP